LNKSAEVFLQGPQWTGLHGNVSWDVPGAECVNALILLFSHQEGHLGADSQKFLSQTYD